MKFGIFANYTHEKTSEIVRNIVQWCRAKNVSLYFDPQVSERESFDGPVLNLEDPTGIDTMIVIGGDGTILAASNLLSRHGIPIFGINVGGLGFLTSSTSNDYVKYLEDLLKGDFIIQERMMLEVSVHGTGKGGDQIFHALNDAVVYKGGFSRIVELKIQIGEDLVGTFKSDGVIVSTPTGSTGYSLSSGGPLVLPTMAVIVVTPICPHTLGARPLVLPHEKRVTIEVMSKGIDLTLTVDGQKGTTLGEGSRITVSRSERTTRLVRSTKESFFTLLQRKLGWIVREE